MTENEYDMHVYSRLSRFAPTNDLSEKKVVGEVARLHTVWDRESGADRHYTYEERKEYFQGDAERDAIFVLVEHQPTQEMVGYGEVTKEDPPLFALAYVEPGHRRSGVFDRIVKTVFEASKQAGYATLDAEPAADGRAKRILERNGFVSIGSDDSGIVMRKTLGGPRPHSK